MQMKQELRRRCCVLLRRHIRFDLPLRWIPSHFFSFSLLLFQTVNRTAFDCYYYVLLLFSDVRRRPNENVCVFHCSCSHFFFSLTTADRVKLQYNLVAALLANAFFSTFPKRTEKTHPTLQDFNFTHFFRTLTE